jgi:hypothetical protein
MAIGITHMLPSAIPVMSKSAGNIGSPLGEGKTASVARDAKPRDCRPKPRDRAIFGPALRMSRAMGHWRVMVRTDA